MTDGKRIEQTEVFAMGLESESKGQSEGKGWGSYLNQESKSELSGVDHASSACDKSPCLTGTSFNRPLSPAAPTTPSLHIRRTTNNAISVFIATLFPPSPRQSSLSIAVPCCCCHPIALSHLYHNTGRPASIDSFHLLRKPAEYVCPTTIPRLVA